VCQDGGGREGGGAAQKAGLIECSDGWKVLRVGNHKPRAAARLPWMHAHIMLLHTQ
jgi:hypothetical protein